MKYIFHLKNYGRGIVVSEDSSLSINDMIAKMSSAMLSTELVEFSTKTDTLIVRPNDILAIQITGNSVEVSGNDDTGNVKREVTTVTEATLQEEILQLEIDDPVNQIETTNTPVVVEKLKEVNGKKTPPPLIPPERLKNLPNIDIDLLEQPSKKEKVSPWLNPIETKIPDEYLEKAKKSDGFIPYE